MHTHISSPSAGARLGLRLRLAIEFGLLIAIVATALASLQIGKTRVRGLVDQNLADRQLSHFATEIVIQSLLCRRFEKDILLNLNEHVVRSDYFARWNQATADLDRAIQGFGAAAATIADREQADTWRTESANYRAAVLQTIHAIDSSTIAAPEEANILLVPAKDTIRNLTDTAVSAARDKDTAVRSSSDALSGIISGNARMIVLFGLIGLILCSALNRR
jgi:hypothetical protein